jgi:hypothetical protein
VSARYVIERELEKERQNSKQRNKDAINKINKINSPRCTWCSAGLINLVKCVIRCRMMRSLVRLSSRKSMLCQSTSCSVHTKGLYKRNKGVVVVVVEEEEEVAAAVIVVVVVVVVEVKVVVVAVVVQEV